MNEIKTERIAYHFPTKEALMQFTEEHKGEILRPRNMIMCYGFGGCHTYSFHHSKKNYYMYEWTYCTKKYYKAVGYQILVYAKQKTE